MTGMFTVHPELRKKNKHQPNNSKNYLMTSWILRPSRVMTFYELVKCTRRRSRVTF